jgi:sulfatase maturation enzyme AslB (radical SAM superfamily)
MCQDAELKREFTSQATIDASRLEWYRNPEFWSNLKTFLPHVKEILLGGGEPFLVKEQFAFVKSCCDLGEAGHIRLRYHTNGTVFPEEMGAYWEQFERVHFMVSLDGIGDVAHYVRYPSNWREIEGNIRRFDSLGENTATNFNFTTHALNIYRIPEVCDWAETAGLRSRKYFSDMQDYVCPSLVHYPAYQNIRVLPTAYKQVITDKMGEYMRKRMAGQAVDKVDGIIGFMNSEDHSQRMPSLVEYTQLLDATHGTDFFQTFPELASYWTRRESGLTR